MSIPSRIAPRLQCLRLASSGLHRQFFTTSAWRGTEDWPQRTPLGGYYEILLNDPTPLPFDHKPEEPPNTADPTVLPKHKKPLPPLDATKSPTQTASVFDTSSSQNSSTEPTAAEKASQIFGTRLSGPDALASHAASKQSKSTYIGDVLVPPKPQEPDNCCMSGCPNCVWDLFREDMEEWTAKKEAAEAKLGGAAKSPAADKEDSKPIQAPSGVEVGDAKIAKDLWDEALFNKLPVGIREFMKHEKRLRERHEREDAASS